MNYLQRKEAIGEVLRRVPYVQRENRDAGDRKGCGRGAPAVDQRVRTWFSTRYLVLVPYQTLQKQSWLYSQSYYYY